MTATAQANQCLCDIVATAGLYRHDLALD